MKGKEIWEKIKENKWTIWKYFRAIYWLALFAISITFILILVITLFI
jgi:hypothetical protein